jgi:hypothetical protein
VKQDIVHRHLPSAGLKVGSSDAIRKYDVRFLQKCCCRSLGCPKPIYWIIAALSRKEDIPDECFMEEF